MWVIYCEKVKSIDPVNYTSGLFWSYIHGIQPGYKFASKFSDWDMIQEQVKTLRKYNPDLFIYAVPAKNGSIY